MGICALKYPQSLEVRARSSRSQYTLSSPLSLPDGFANSSEKGFGLLESGSEQQVEDIKTPKSIGGGRSKTDNEVGVASADDE
jgi:hypothetical protein